MTKKIIILYYSKTGKTKNIAETIQKTFRAFDEKDIDISLMDARNIDYSIVKNADGYIIGTPNYFDAPSGYIKIFFDTIFEERITLSDRPVFWFTSHRGSGPLEQFESLCNWLELKIIGEPILEDESKPSKHNIELIKKNLKEMIRELS